MIDVCVSLMYGQQIINRPGPILPAYLSHIGDDVNGVDSRASKC
jgi:hypothetical protein